MGTPHTVAFTSSTVTVTTDRKKFIIGDALPFETLGFMRSVSKCAQKSGKPEVPYKKPSYFSFSSIQNGQYKQYDELDVNSAYWKIAYQLGYITNQVYEKGLTVDKMARLMALGGIATAKRVYEFVPSKGYKYLETIQNKVTRSYFFDIANELDTIMSSIIKERSFEVLLYWVDAFFLKDYIVDEVKEELKKYDLDSKVKHVDTIEAFSLNKNTQQINVKMKDGGVKPFFRNTAGYETMESKISEFQADIERFYQA